MRRSWLTWLASRARSVDRAQGASRSPRAQKHGRRIVVGDVHGCARTLTALLEEEIRITPGDRLFLLGDLISKGPDVPGVLAYLEALEARGIATTVIRGNHEAALLAAQAEGGSQLKSHLERTGNEALLAPDKPVRLDPRWERIIAGSVHFVSLPDALLVHAGFNFSRKDPFTPHREMFEMREFVYDEEKAGGRPVVFGHVRTPLSEIIEALVNNAPTVPLDNGAVGASSRKPFKVSEYGNLCCLDLESWSLHVQPNRDVTGPADDPAAFSLRVHSPRTGRTGGSSGAPA